jgi:hypothetical protein
LQSEKAELQWLIDQGPSFLLVKAMYVTDSLERASQVARAVIPRESKLARSEGLSCKERSARSLRLLFCHIVSGGRRSGLIALDDVHSAYEMCRNQAEDFTAIPDMLGNFAIGCILIDERERLSSFLRRHYEAGGIAVPIADAWLSDDDDTPQRMIDTLNAHIEKLGISIISDTWHMVLKKKLSTKF